MSTTSRPGRTTRFLPGYPSVHCWLLWPLQPKSWTLAPSAVEAPVTSRHSPDWTPVTVPLELRFHCWLVCPLHGQMITGVPLVVPRPEASRHKVLPPVVIVSWLAEVRVQVWAARPLQ